MNGPQTASSAPGGHLNGLRGRLFSGVAVKPREALLTIILVLAFLAMPVSSHGQQPEKVYRIGWLSTARSEATPRNCPRKGNLYWQTWIEGLRSRGYLPGRNLLIDCRYTEGRSELAIPFATELVNLRPDLIVVANTANVRAAMQVTNTIPIVMLGVLDPVRRGLVRSLARPGGNVTGVADDSGLEMGIFGKYLDLLAETVPGISRVAAIRAANVPLAWLSTLEAEARAVGVTLHLYPVRDPDELEGAFAAMAKARAEALLVVPSPFFEVHAQRIVNLAARRRLPAIYDSRKYVELGGLMAYTMDELEIFRLLPGYVDRILKGAKPGDLPVEQPAKFTLVLNLKTAKVLGLTIPPTILLQAEEVIR